MTRQERLPSSKARFGAPLMRSGKIGIHLVHHVIGIHLALALFGKDVVDFDLQPQ